MFAFRNEYLNDDSLPLESEELQILNKIVKSMEAAISNINSDSSMEIDSESNEDSALVDSADLLLRGVTSHEIMQSRFLSVLYNYLTAQEKGIVWLSLFAFIISLLSLQHHLINRQPCDAHHHFHQNVLGR